MPKKSLAAVADRLAAAAGDADALRTELSALADAVAALDRVGAKRASAGEWATFAEWLREKIEASGLSERAAADLTGVPYGTLHNFLNIAGRTPNVGAVVKIAAAFGSDLNELSRIREFSK